ncbi:MAG: DUF1194 domain-containing protein [Sneathiellales bacterium]|nr:DUF1194 domain-containing protein [Sneathiellales bacterium]
MTRTLLILISISWGLLNLPFASKAKAEEVDLLLVLAMDVSSSVNFDEYGLQLNGYAGALRSPEVFNAIESGVHKKIAVTVTQWAGVKEQSILVDWKVIQTREDLEDLAEVIEYSSRAFPYGGTAIAEALQHAGNQFVRTTHSAPRRVIDMSGDGKISIGQALEPVRDRIVKTGVTINGLPILNEEGKLDEYYRNRLIGGVGSFIEPARDFRSFEKALTRKLVREIKGLWYGV